MSESEDAFTKFFNGHMPLVHAMDDGQLHEHICLLEEICLEGKAKLTAAKTVQRDRVAKKRLGGEWTITDVNPNVGDKSVSEAINKVQLRTSRMSKLDKTRAKLEALGLSDKEINQMVSTMMKQARKEPEQAAADADKVGKLAHEIQNPADLSNKGESANGEADTANTVTSQSPMVETTNSKPLDLSTLKFG